MVQFWWLWVAAGGGIAVGMFLFSLMAMAADDPRRDAVTPPTTDALI